MSLFLANSGIVAPASAGGGGPTPDPFTGVFCCGFECGINDTTANSHFWTGSAAAEITTSVKRTGNRSLRIFPTANNPSVSTPTGVAPTVAVGRVYVRFSALPDGNTYIIWAGSSTARVGVGFNASDSKIYAATGTSPSFGAAGISVTTGVWYRIDFKLDQTSGARAVDVEIDGAAVAQKTSAVAGAGGDISLGSLAAITAEYFFDDFALSGTAGDYPIGAGRVDHFVAVADGAHNTGAAGNFIVGSAGANITNLTTDSHLLIDEVPLDDTTPDTNDFITQVNIGATEYVEHIIGPAPGVSTPTEPPRTVEVIFGSHSATSSSGNRTLKLNDNGTESTVAAVTSSSTSTQYRRGHFAEPPSAATEWHVDNDGSDGDFRDLRVRFGYSADATPDQCLDCVMVEAEFQE